MGLIPEESVQQILDRADIVEVVSTYIPLKPAGRNFKALSPFRHEKTPSFIVSPDKQIFHCFSSGIGGNVISFVMKMERVSFPEAVRLLAERYQVVIPETGPSKDDEAIALARQIYQLNQSAVGIFHSNLLKDRSPETCAARGYLKGRGIDLTAVQSFQLGFALNQWDALLKTLQTSANLAVMEKGGLIIPRKSGTGYYDRFRNRIIFPIFDERGRPAAFGARAMEPDSPAKYLNSPESPVYVKGRHLYGFHLSKQDVARDDQIIIVEGYMDFITPFIAGIRNIAASLGTALTVDQIRLIRRYTRNVVMLFDADPAGESAMNRSLDLLVDEGMNVRIAVLASQEDPDSYIRSYGVEAFRQCLAAAKSLVDFKLGFLLGRYGQKTVEARSRVVSEMLPTIARFQDPISRIEAVKALARAVSVVQGALMTEAALLEELKKMARQGSSPQAESRVNHLDSVDQGGWGIMVSPAERTLLMLLLTDRRCIESARANDPAEIFSDARVRTLVERIYEMYDHGQEISLPGLISLCDEQTGNYLSGLAADTSAVAGDTIKMCQDCLMRLKRDQLRQRRRFLLAEMEVAREHKDQKRLEELTQEFNRHIKGVS